MGSSFIKMHLKKFAAVTIVLCLSAILLLGLYWDRDIHAAPLDIVDQRLPTSEVETYLHGMLPMNHFDENELRRKFELNLENHDVIVFLHLQKTGGTSFGKHLTRHLLVDPPCVCFRKQKKCDCLTKKKRIWLFSRYSTGWPCGLHADWTELKSCVDHVMNKKEQAMDVFRNRRYHYVTVLRDPVKRYLSEWKHVQRGATWKGARLSCGGHSASLKEVPFCYNSSDWTGVTLNEFLACNFNLAHNRQTRMMANLTKIGCYEGFGTQDEERDEMMLESAKRNLIRMDYFGLTEFQKYSQLLFEHTFNLKFEEEFTQSKVSRTNGTIITVEQKEKIVQRNKLDIKFYQFAKDLFLQRVRQMKRDLHDSTEVYDYESDNIFELGDDDDDDEDEDVYDGDEAIERTRL